MIRSNFPLIFWKRFDLIALKPFCLRSFIASGFMSATVMFFLSMNFEAVSARIPEPVPMSSNFREVVFLIRGCWVLDRYFLRKSLKRNESSEG